MFRLAVALVLTGCAPGFCQLASTDSSQPKPSDPAVFESFFHQVEELQHQSGPLLLNGRPSNLRRPTVQVATGLTDEEARILDAIASDCQTKLTSFDVSVRPFVFEARLQLMEPESAPEATQKLKDVESERGQIVLRHVQQLKAAFGDSRFQIVDTYVRSRKSGNDFFPLTPNK
ncbi:MAG TPA: hypothetical protein VG675_07530 [Bryobacteraceae bacterium]|nr:hypothetical protein [Bryobacteraceae bacterium]